MQPLQKHGLLNLCNNINVSSVTPFLMSHHGCDWLQLSRNFHGCHVSGMISGMLLARLHGFVVQTSTALAICSTSIIVPGRFHLGRNFFFFFLVGRGITDNHLKYEYWDSPWQIFLIIRTSLWTTFVTYAKNLREKTDEVSDSNFQTHRLEMYTQMGYR